MLYFYLNYFLALSLILTISITFFNVFFSFTVSLYFLKIKYIMYIICILYFKIVLIFSLYRVYSFNLINMFNSLDYFYFSYYFPFLLIFVLITSISLVFCLNYNFYELNYFITYCFFIIFFGFNLILTNSILLFFFYYECLLLPSFFILYIFSKTRRSVEAAYLMFFWTQFGALWLIFSFIYIFSITNSFYFDSIKFFNFSKFDSYFIFFSILLGFGVKLPIWPFYEWLPKAHVEASTNFSIFLSGVLVKFAFFGFYKCLISLSMDINFFLIFPYLLVGLIDSTFKMFYQIDIKKLIAYSTVVEMHWLLICIINGNNILLLSGFGMLISHAILSTNSFLIVDSISRRFKTRLITEISGLNFLCPKLFIICLVNIVIFLGFPGSLFFISEFVFFSFLFDVFPLYSFIVLFFVYFVLASFFIKIWMNVLFGSINNNIKKIPLDLDKTELAIFCFMILVIFLLGNSFISIIF